MILVTLPLLPGEREALLAQVSDRAIAFADDLPQEGRKRAFVESEVVFGHLPPEWIAESERLRWIQLPSAGYDPYLPLDWARLRGRLTLTNMGPFFGVPVAESALAGILALYRGILPLQDAQRARAWVSDDVRYTLRILRGAKVVILGSGAIGRALRDALAGFACDVTLMGRTSPGADVYTLEELDAVLPEADVVAGCLPEAPETMGLMSRERLALLKADALFVNVGRGSLVDEAALVEMLQQGRLGGCVLDVTAEEPLPADHPLWTCPNTLLTQHTGGGTLDETEGKVRLFAENLGRYRRGEALMNVVRL